jgi:hypothetical protein
MTGTNASPSSTAPAGGRCVRRRLVGLTLLACLSVPTFSIAASPLLPDLTTVSSSSAYRLIDAYHASILPPATPGSSLTTNDLHTGTEFFYRLPSQFVYESLNGLSRPSLLGAFEHAQATVRYAWLARPGWSIKLGLVTDLDARSSLLQTGLISPEHLRNAGVPQWHLASEGLLSPHWRVSLDAQSTRLLHPQALDLNLRLDYRLTPHLDLYSAYRLSDAQADGIDPLFNPAPANLARFGLSLRF